MIRICRRIVEWPWFDRGIIALIILNAIVLGLETYPVIAVPYESLLLGFNKFVLIVFAAEAALKITASAPVFKRYFGDGWNLFDFCVVVFSLIPQTGELALIARTIRLLRILRLVTVVPELRLIISTLIKSLPGLGNVILLLSIVFYVYAIAGYHMFHEHDPFHWNSLGISLITLFRILTLEDWTDVMYAAMELYPLAWMYFVSFVVVAAFIVINMFIAVVINNLHKAQQEAEISTGENLYGEILYELAESRRVLEKVERALNSQRGDNPKPGSSDG
ncbi:MAG: ion transporter [Acidiferrobacterales bacterium]|nr:ion transporter [Acidiferrobacterales bacterium]